jgi:hypothetical protein
MVWTEFNFLSICVNGELLYLQKQISRFHEMLANSWLVKLLSIVLHFVTQQITESDVKY